MDDYISREKVIDFCEGVIKTHTDGSHRQRVARAFENAKAFFETIPVADVRPVVLCRDCKHMKADLWGYPLWCCRPEITPQIVTKDFFCAAGERKETDDGS